MRVVTHEIQDKMCLTASNHDDFGVYNISKQHILSFVVIIYSNSMSMVLGLSVKATMTSNKTYHP